MPSASKSTRNWLTLEQKFAVCQQARRGRSAKPFTNVELAEWATSAFGLARPLSPETVRKILKREVELANVPSAQLSRKTIVPEHQKVADERIMSVFQHMDGVVGSITGDVIRAIALHVKPDSVSSDPKLSNGWLYRLQQRQGISLKRKHGEAASIDDDAVRAGLDKMRKLTLPFARSDIYNMDETSFFFRSDAKTTLSTRKTVSGKKDPKNRITLALTVNADGTDKLSPLYIGSAKVPRPLKGRDVRTV